MSINIIFTVTYQLKLDNQNVLQQDQDSPLEEIAVHFHSVVRLFCSRLTETQMLQVTLY